MRGVSKITDSVEVRLGGLGIADLLWRVPEATPGDTSIADTVLVAFSATFGQLPFFESATVWILIGYASFTLASEAYPGLYLPKERRGFRALFAAGTVTAVAVVRLIGREGPDLQTVGAVLVWLVIFGGIFLGYLYRLGWRVDLSDDRAAEALARVLPTGQSDARQRLREEWSEPGWHGTANRAVAWGALGVLAAFPGFLAAIVTATLSVASPLGELFFLFAVVLSAIRKNTRFGSSRSPRQVVDLETYLYDSISQVFRGLHATILLTYLFCSILIISIGGLSITVAAVPNIAAAAAGVLFEGQRTLLEGVELYLMLSVPIGAIVLVVGGCAYTAWAGLREVPRLAAFIDVQQGKEPGQVPARPVGFIIPGLLMILLFSFIATQAETVSVSQPLDGGLRLFAICWPLLLIGLVACWWMTRRRSPQSVKNENHVIISCVGLLVGVLGIVSNESRTFAAVPFIIVFGYFPYVTEYAHRYEHTVLRQYAIGAYFIVLGVIAWVAARAYFDAAHLLGLLFVLLGVVSIIITATDAPTGGSSGEDTGRMNSDSDTQQASFSTNPDGRDDNSSDES